MDWCFFFCSRKVSINSSVEYAFFKLGQFFVAQEAYWSVYQGFSCVLTLPDYRILYSMENQPCNPTSIRKCFRHVFAYTVISHIARYQTKHLSDSNSSWSLQDPSSRCHSAGRHCMPLSRKTLWTGPHGGQVTKFISRDCYQIKQLKERHSTVVVSFRPQP